MVGNTKLYDFDKKGVKLRVKSNIILAKIMVYSLRKLKTVITARNYDYRSRRYLTNIVLPGPNLLLVSLAAISDKG